MARRSSGDALRRDPWRTAGATTGDIIQIAGIVVLAASVLLLRAETVELTRQSKLANDDSGARTLRDAAEHLGQVLIWTADPPEMRAYFSTAPSLARTQAAAETIAEVLLDAVGVPIEMAAMLDPLVTTYRHG